MFTLQFTPNLTCIAYTTISNQVLRLFGQQLVTRRDSGEMEFYFHRISAVKQLLQAVTGQPFFSASPGDQMLAKEPEDSGYNKIAFFN